MFSGLGLGGLGSAPSAASLVSTLAFLNNPAMTLATRDTLSPMEQLLLGGMGSGGIKIATPRFAANIGGGTGQNMAMAQLANQLLADSGRATTASSTAIPGPTTKISPVTSTRLVDAPAALSSWNQFNPWRSGMGSAFDPGFTLSNGGYSGYDPGFNLSRGNFSAYDRGFNPWR